MCSYADKIVEPFPVRCRVKLPVQVIDLFILPLREAAVTGNTIIQVAEVY